MCLKDGKGYLEHIAFRECLRTHNEATEEYQKLKIELAKKYAFNRESYSIGKTDFVKSILNRTAI